MGDVKAIGDRAHVARPRPHRRDSATPTGSSRNTSPRWSEKDSAYLELKNRRRIAPAAPLDTRPPEVVTHIPNIDHRHGDGRAEVIGIAVLRSSYGEPLSVLEPISRIIVRISVARPRKRSRMPNVGFMLRNHLGIDFSGTNTLTRRPRAAADGGRATSIPSISIWTCRSSIRRIFLVLARPSPTARCSDYKMCDWIDNAITAADGPRRRARFTAICTCPAAWK